MSTDAAPAPTSAAPVEPTGATTPEAQEGTQPKNDGKNQAATNKQNAPKPEVTKGPSPWEAELAERGLNDPKFAEYMREKQGYITQLEQGNAQFKQLFGEGPEAAEVANIAANVLKGLDENPVETIQEIVRLLELDPVDLFGDPEDLPEYPEGEEYDESEFYDEGEEQPADPYRQWVEQKMAAEQEAQEDAAYEQILTAIGKQHGGFNPKVFHNYVLAFGGDVKSAYTEYAQDFPPQVKPVAPPVIGGNGGQIPPQPEKDYGKDFGGAVDDFMAELKASRRR